MILWNDSSGKELDSSVDNTSESSDTEERKATEAFAGTSTMLTIQEQILKELQRVNSRLDVVEHKVTEKSATQEPKKDIHKLSYFSKHKRVSKHCKHRKSCYVSSESSFDDSEVPELSYLKSNKSIQKKVDDRLAELEKSVESKGKSEKLKSKWGGLCRGFWLKKRVAWPHDVTLGGSKSNKGHI